MSMPPPLPPPRPWYTRWWGITYLGLLAFTAVGGLLVALIPVPRGRGEGSLEKVAYLIPVAGTLDLLLAIPIAVWAFHSRVRHLTRAPAADLLIGLLLFLALTAAVVVFFFFACLGAASV